MNEDESDDDCCERALSDTDDMTGVDRDFDITGRGRNYRTVDAARWVWVTKRLVSGCSRVQGDCKTYPDPVG
jgi:hypothetical protein